MLTRSPTPATTICGVPGQVYSGQVANPGEPGARLLNQAQETAGLRPAICIVRTLRQGVVDRDQELFGGQGGDYFGNIEEREDLFARAGKIRYDGRGCGRPSFKCKYGVLQIQKLAAPDREILEDLVFSGASKLTSRRISE